MKISVVMAVRDGEAHVGEAIESVLAQSITDFELLIVDDGSRDDTPRILAEYQGRDSRISILTNPVALGPYPSAKGGLARARGDLVARHDADDVSPPTRFAIQLDAFESGGGTALVTGAVESFGPRQPRSVQRPPTWQPRLEWELLFKNVIGAGAHVMFPRIVHGKPVVFPARYPYAEDYRLWCTLSRLGSVVCPDQIIYRYRQHSSSISRSQRGRQHECFVEMRREYQAECLERSLDADLSIELSRFWNREGKRPYAVDVKRAHAVLIELQGSFLEYIQRRYGAEESTKLRVDLDAALGSRLGYWLYRSAWFADRRACSEILALAGDKQHAFGVARKAAGHAAAAVLRKLRPASGRSGDSPE